MKTQPAGTFFSASQNKTNFLRHGHWTSTFHLFFLGIKSLDFNRLRKSTLSSTYDTEYVSISSIGEISYSAEWYVMPLDEKKTMAALKLSPHLKSVDSLIWNVLQRQWHARKMRPNEIKRRRDWGKTKFVFFGVDSFTFIYTTLINFQSNKSWSI